MSSLGDVIHALPTLAALRKNLPESKITWAIHENFADILPGKPYIDEIIYIDRHKLKSPMYLMALRKELHSCHFDMVLDLQCIAKSAIVSYLSGAPERYGYWELREGSKFVNKPLVGEHQFDHVIERYLDTIRALDGEVKAIEFPLPVDKTAIAAAKGMLADEIAEGEEYVVIAPGARWTIKEWSSQAFGELAARIVHEGKHIVLVGAKSDIAKGITIESTATHIALLKANNEDQGISFEENSIKRGKIINLIGKTSLRELIEIIRGARIYISADTGPLHIANALKKELIALFGPTSPERTGPYGGEHIHLVISPTSKATTAEPLINDPECMNQITVDMVWQVYQEIVADNS